MVLLPGLKAAFADLKTDNLPFGMLMLTLTVEISISWGKTWHILNAGQHFQCGSTMANEICLKTTPNLE